MKKFLLLGAGELGKEFAISAKRYGFYVVAVDHYPNAPAMQIADECEMIDMLDGSELDNVIDRHKPDYIVPEVESICVEKLFEFEDKGYTVVPSAKAVNVTMNRKKTRELARELGFTTARYTYANSMEELKEAAEKIGYPCVVKPLMSSSGKGQSVLKKEEDIPKVWMHAINGSRGNILEVIVEEFIDFDFEITLLTITSDGEDVKFCEPIMHTQENGDFRESWQPCINEFHTNLKKDAKEMATKMTRELGGNGIWGVEFFLSKEKGVIFSELSPRPHDTGMVTKVTQNQNEFELHMRAIVGWKTNPALNAAKSGAICAILANTEAIHFRYNGLEKAAELGEFRIFGKPKVWKDRRIGIALAYSNSSYYDTWRCRNKAREIAACITTSEILK